jgi:hypothetical protein
MNLRLSSCQVGISALRKKTSGISLRSGIYPSKDGHLKRISKNKTSLVPTKIIYNRVVIGTNSASNSTIYRVSGGVRLYSVSPFNKKVYNIHFISIFCINEPTISTLIPNKGHETTIYGAYK